MVLIVKIPGLPTIIFADEIIPPQAVATEVEVNGPTGILTATLL